MQVNELKIALFSGNYNYVRDGANKALNKLVEYLLRMGAQVRVYSPTVDNPAFEPMGDLISVPSFAIPGRPEYRIPLQLSNRIKEDLREFSPNIVHISSPDRVARQAVKWAHSQNIPVLCSVHTRFESYLQYYKLGLFEPVMVAWLRSLYRHCDALVAPSEGFAELLRSQHMNQDVGIWTRGVNRDVFNASKRDMAWRKSIGFDDNIPVIGFLGRLVLEKGLDVFAESLSELGKRNIPHQVMIIGDGPAKNWFAERVPHANFLGFQGGHDLGRAVASMDMLFNPSTTEGFSNVSLETMACAVPVIAARATGNVGLVQHNITGQLVTPGNIPEFADALQHYCQNIEISKLHGKAGEALSLEYSWDSINQVVADKYIELIGRHITS
ncbi:glycosyl transferase family 1 [Sphingorhabdus lutea]|uniref:Glycosyl transferase family 1 n=1 Tax=Sphingorhabdus lutea TaxID=1913578 RepID=A0A1L3JD51_9SPHN|nr:glycosyltransferase family 1 protein [Sphingorhabdus lutea]APG63050.1 glycosyl transferase family 1 [Sphingorhabdus lutea]